MTKFKATYYVLSVLIFGYIALCIPALIYDWSSNESRYYASAYYQYPDSIVLNNIFHNTHKQKNKTENQHTNLYIYFTSPFSQRTIKLKFEYNTNRLFLNYDCIYSRDKSIESDKSWHHFNSSINYINQYIIPLDNSQLVFKVKDTQLSDPEEIRKHLSRYDFISFVNGIGSLVFLVISLSLFTIYLIYVIRETRHII